MTGWVSAIQQAVLIAMVGLLVITTNGCNTTKEEPTSITQLRDTAAAANAVYLCDIAGRPRAVQLRVRAVWRHDPALGPEPAPGAPVNLLLNKSIVDPGITAALVFIYEPPLPLLNGNTMPNRTIYVFGNEIAAFRTTLEDAEKIVREIKTPPAAPASAGVGFGPQ